MTNPSSHWRFMIHLGLVLFALPTFSSPTPFPHSYEQGDYDYNSSNPESSDEDWTTTYPASSYEAYPIPPANYDTVRIIHAILGSVAVLFIFPLGGIIVRVCQHRHIVWIHGAVQCFGLLVFAAAAGCGIWMADQIWETGAYHPLIGMVLLGLLALQPLSEVVNHHLFQRYPRAIYLAHIHLWLGRILITLGIVNGGLGFAFAESHPGPRWGSAPKIAYGVIATVVWIVYVAIAVVWQELKTSKNCGSETVGVAGEDMQELRMEGRTQGSRERVDEDGPGAAVRERQFT